MNADVVHVPDGDCEPVVVELSDEFGEVREVYLDYETAGALTDQLLEVLTDTDEPAPRQPTAARYGVVD